MTQSLSEKIEDILRPAIDVRAPYARQMIRALEHLIDGEILDIVGYHAARKNADAPKRRTRKP